MLTGVTEQNGSAASYGYDALYRLTSDSRTGTNAGSHSYGYDLAGNATTVNGSTFATYDNANKISSLSGGTISYDADGNLTSVSGTNVPASTFTWDERDRMLSATANSTTVNYGYGANGFRTWSQVGSGTKTFYLYSGTALLGEIPAGSSTPSAVYTWGATGLISERLTATNKSLWYAFGPQGETRQLTDNTGAVVDTYAYSPYGVPIASTGTDANPFRYGGQAGYYTDANNPTGTILCGLRWYMPQLGRWFSHDPIGYNGGYNLYEYCGSNPVMGLDPLGLQNTHLLPPEQQQQLYNTFQNTIQANPNLVGQGAATTLYLGSEASTYLGGASFFGPIGVAAVAIPALSYGTYTYIGVPLGNALFGPQTLGGTSAAPGFESLYVNAMRKAAVRYANSIFADPTQLSGQCLEDVEKRLQYLPSNWIVGKLAKGSKAGSGWTLRLKNESGNLTDKYIQWHPGGGHHGEMPYWKVSSGLNGIQRCPSKL